MRRSPARGYRCAITHDLVIRGGTIVDGTGRAGFAGDIAIEGECIVEIGDVSGAAHGTIDADGAVVTPGFVDIHTHLDAQLAWDWETYGDYLQAILGLELPELVHDFPTGAGRYVQRSRGYALTIVNGQVFVDHGTPTGTHAGHALRSYKPFLPGSRAPGETRAYGEQ